jgi:hypothetical protein
MSTLKKKKKKKKKKEEEEEIYPHCSSRISRKKGSEF